MSRSGALPLVVGVLLLAALALFVALRLEVTTDIAHFLPDADAQELSAISRRIAESELSRTMVLTLEGDPDTDLPSASRALEAALRAEPRVRSELAFLEGGPAEGVERAMWELYRPRHLSFLAESPVEARRRISDQGLAEAAARLREELAGPMSPLMSRIAPRDPLLILPDLFRDLETSRADDLALADGRFSTSDGEAAVLFLGTRSSAFDAEAQRPFLEGLEAAFREVDAAHGGSLSLDRSGINRFATRAADAIRSDVRRVSILSIMLLGALLLLFFRSLRLVGLASIPVLAGVITGSAITLAIFGQLHGVTLAFGASLIGVSIDYVVHLYCHHTVVAPTGGPRATLSAIRAALVTGASTTIAGFLALSVSSLVGLREVACFSAAGIVGAFLATYFMLPSLMPHRAKEVAVRRRLVRALGSLLGVLRRRRRYLWPIPLFALGVAAAIVPRARFEEDFARLGTLDQDLVAEDERVRERVARFEHMRFVVAIGESEAEALSSNDRVAVALDAAEDAGELEAHRGVARLLPSPARQRAVAGVAREDETLRSRFERAFAEAGFDPARFAPFFATLRERSPPPLDHAALLSSPIGGLVRPFRVDLGNRVGFLTFLHGIRDAEALEARIAEIPGAVFFRQADLMGRAHRRYQKSTIELLAWGLFAILVLLTLRYRDARRIFAAFVPSVLSVGVTVSVLTLVGRGLDLVTLTALLFVVSMGVDYGVFLVDANGSEGEKDLEAAFLSVLLACVSTVLGFGLLAFSDHPVLSSLGITAAAGIGASLVLAPTTLVLLPPPARGAKED